MITRLLFITLSLLVLSDNHNSAKGRHSYDSVSTGSLIPFFNRNVSEYPTEAGSVKFDLVPVQSQKDLMLNTARIYAQQEYDRIMSLVKVLEDQALAIKRRLEVTDWVYAAEYRFEVRVGHEYWLVHDTRQGKNILTPMSPDSWSTAAPDHYEYIAHVKYLGDHTWCEVDGQGRPL